MDKAVEYFGGDELPASVWKEKYALRDRQDKLVEDTPDDMHRRLAREFARVEKKKFKKPYSEEFIYQLLKEYGPVIPQGSPMYAIGNQAFCSTSNCFVVTPPTDSYGGIMRTDEEMVQLCKRRGGVGTDLSFIRPDSMPTTNSARKATGIVPFMERYSNTIREVGQNGRRGALMLTISVHHPQVLDFARVKLDPTKVTGANVSVRLSDEFLQAVKEDKEYEQRWPVDSKSPQISRKVKAREVWEEIVKCAHARAEPGLLFWDRTLAESPADCYSDCGFATVSTNPCCIDERQNVNVLTRRGWVDIKTVVDGDEVWVDYLARWYRTTGYFYEGEAEVFKVSFADGTYLSLTSNHRLLSLSTTEMVQVKDLLPGMVIKRTLGGIGSKEPHVERGDWSDKTVVSVEPNGIARVGCINVPDVGVFEANGVSSGNSEIGLSILDSCRLLVINLFCCVNRPFRSSASFSWEKLKEYGYIGQRLMDDLVDLEIECIDRILQKIESDPEDEQTKRTERDTWLQIRKSAVNGRRTGLGPTALGDTMAAVGIRYGSDESIEFTERVYRTLKLAAYRASVDMAKELGAFPVWDREKEKNCPFLKRIEQEDPELYADMQKYGRRNIALLTTAPTGSVSIQAGPAPYFGTTSGIEPLFRAEPYTRRKKINHAEKGSRVDFTDANGDQWTEYPVYHSKLKMWMDVTGETDWKKSPYAGCCAEDLDWKQRVRLQAAAQKHIDHSISSTINLPNDVTVEKVAEIYETAWEAGCKGITVYRAGCRDGVLVDKPTKKGDRVTKTTAPKRPKELPCEVHRTTAKGEACLVFVGKLQDDPYEVFAVLGETEIDPKCDAGVLKKERRGDYKFRCGDAEFNLTEALTDEQAAITRLASTALRHGADVAFVVHQLEKIKGPINGFSKAVARTLKKYVKDGTKVTGEQCQKCESAGLVRQEGCVTCLNCGWTKCS